MAIVRKTKLYAISATCILVSFSLDYLSKSWAHAALQPYVRCTFIPRLLNFILVDNTGLAFSIANQNELLARCLATLVFLGVVGFYFARNFKPRLQISLLEEIGLSIIIGAAAGNLFERFVCGHVTDFIEFAFMNFPVFNLADALIDVGVGLILIAVYCQQKAREIAARKKA